MKWDLRFLEMAELVAGWSKDPSTKCGAVIVGPNREIESLGYNGFPRGMDDSPELYADRDVKYSRVVHCEMNALLNTDRSVSGCTLYTWPFLSCDRCAVHVIQAGIVRCVSFTPSKDINARWSVALARSRKYFQEAGVICEELSNRPGPELKLTGA